MPLRDLILAFSIFATSAHVASGRIELAHGLIPGEVETVRILGTHSQGIMIVTPRYSSNSATEQWQRGKKGTMNLGPTANWAYTPNARTVLDLAVAGKDNLAENIYFLHEPRQA